MRLTLKLGALACALAALGDPWSLRGPALLVLAAITQIAGIGLLVTLLDGDHLDWRFMNLFGSPMRFSITLVLLLVILPLPFLFAGLACLDLLPG